MQSLLKSDIFFFITTIVVAVLGLILAVALVYVVRILRDLNTLSEKAKKEGGRILDDVRAFREDMRDRGAYVSGILSLLGLRKKKAKKVEKVAEDDENGI